MFVFLSLPWIPQVLIPHSLAEELATGNHASQQSQEAANSGDNSIVAWPYILIRDGLSVLIILMMSII
jgi:hypothetical protein